MDLDRIVSRTAWLSGHGLAVFVQGELEARALQTVSVVHPQMLHDVEQYELELLDGDGNVEGYRTALISEISKVRRCRLLSLL